MSLDFEGYLKAIIDNIDEDIVKGIAQRAIDFGFNNLSDKQQHILKSG